ncbi:MAG: ATP-binding cassette domain-containing protein, partial [Phycisphaerales bacterium]|nr:ATP-binding cassette domain-containing protein [Phycisphaerales bacterium]
MTDIHIDGLVKTFGSTRAVDGISLTVGSGEMFFLVGPSGCGKTTLLRMLAGFSAPDSGRIRFGSEDVTALPPNQRDIGMVFQEPMTALNPLRRVGDTVMEPMLLHDGLTRRAARARALSLFEEV